MDTRFWGPSGWQLLHLIAHDQTSTPEVRELFFNNIKEILPCKFCRASTAEFMETELPLHKRVNDIARWLYDLHNRVNEKLREQSKSDKNIRDPGPNPSFEEVRDKYTTFLKYSPKQIRVVPGADFMFTLAYNYPETPTSDQIETHMIFWNGLLELYPYPFLREGLRKYIAKNPVYPALQSRSAYMKWVHGLLTKICREKIRSYRGMCQHVGYFKSACNSPFYRGKTCRRSKDGKYIKLRDNNRTYRITHGRLIV